MMLIYYRSWNYGIYITKSTSSNSERIWQTSSGNMWHDIQHGGYSFEFIAYAVERSE